LNPPNDSATASATVIAAMPDGTGHHIQPTSPWPDIHEYSFKHSIDVYNVGVFL